ncbi:hypothetical protein Avbf_14288 [Armadillidium vulgare]|nr:hypothetical protein Avbf_14288 [Armadillidium vulgare]
MQNTLKPSIDDVFLEEWNGDLDGACGLCVPLDSDCYFTLSKTSKEENELTLPYDLPLRPYSSDDVPWFMNTNKSIPDILGQTYP